MGEKCISNKVKEMQQFFEKNCPNNIYYLIKDDLDIILNKIAVLPIHDFIIIYNESDECIDFYIWLPNNIELDFSYFSDDTELMIPFSIYHKKDLLVSNIINIDDLISKMLKVNFCYDD